MGDSRAQKGSKVFSIRKNLVTYSVPLISCHYLICSHHLSSWLRSGAEKCSATSVDRFDTVHCARSLCRRKEREKPFFFSFSKIARQKNSLYGKAKLQSHHVNRYETVEQCINFLPFQLREKIHLHNRCTNGGDFPIASSI